MKIDLAKTVTADTPPNAWGKILTTTPVVMAVVSTLLAGLASSEMTRAQYDRSLAAQQQSKAGDQWSLYQAKKVRAAIQRNSMELLGNLAPICPIDDVTFRLCLDRVSPVGDGIPAKADAIAALETPAGRMAIDALVLGHGADPEPPMPLAPEVTRALAAIGDQRPEDEIAMAVAHVSDASIDQALMSAKRRVQAYDEISKPTSGMIDRLNGVFLRLAASSRSDGRASYDTVEPSPASIKRDLSAASLAYGARRYDDEARLNQDIAACYEVQVRRSNLSAERHHQRSQSFFFGMLGAQLGVIISTVALAARQRNVLWSISAGAGILAVGFAGYVYAFT